MRLTNYICFAKKDLDNLPGEYDTKFKFCHANRPNMMALRTKLKLYKKNLINKNNFGE
jgi:hypothetical protein